MEKHSCAYVHGCFLLSKIVCTTIFISWHHFPLFSATKFQKGLSDSSENPVKSDFLLNYSTIVTTRPEPTARPPSRCYGALFHLTNRDKMRIFYLYYPQYQLIFLVIGNFRSILEARPKSSSIKPSPTNQLYIASHRLANCYPQPKQTYLMYFNCLCFTNRLCYISPKVLLLSPHLPL